jgi:hypothetical protein
LRINFSVYSNELFIHTFAITNTREEWNQLVTRFSKKKDQEIILNQNGKCKKSSI